jgi:hypothetical protein
LTQWCVVPKGAEEQVRAGVDAYLHVVAGAGRATVMSAGAADWRRYVQPRKWLTGTDWLDMENRHLAVVIAHLALLLAGIESPLRRWSLDAPLRDGDAPWPDTDFSVTALRLAALVQDGCQRRRRGAGVGRLTVIVATCGLGAAAKEVHRIGKADILRPPPSWRLHLAGDNVPAMYARRGELHERIVTADAFGSLVLRQVARWPDPSANARGSLLYTPRTSIYKSNAATSSIAGAISDLRAFIGTPNGLRAPGSLRRWAARHDPTNALLILGQSHDLAAARREVLAEEPEDERWP